MGVPSMPELLIILAIVVLLFGAKKIPDLAKGLGTGIKNFKKAVKEEDESADTAKNIEEKEKTAQDSAESTDKSQKA
jgi:sec-independent protein translocase protein TatA